MANYQISLATREDDDLIRECLKQNPMGGAISLAFETEPSYFDAIEIQGKESQVMSLKTSDNELIGFGVRSVKPMHVNGEVQDIGYLSGLRGNPKFTKSIFLAKGYKFFRELDQDGRVPFYLTTVIEDNVVARRILESGRAGLPNYMPIDLLSTFVIKPQDRKRQEVIKGSEVPLEQIVDFLNEEGSKKQFYPYYEVSDFNSERLRGLKQEDFYLAVEGSEIIGAVAKWDQERFKQTRIVRYDKKMRRVRPIVNLASRFSNIPHLPKEGDLLHYFHAAFPTTRDNDPIILEALLSEVASDPENRDYDYFTIGLTKNDPLVEAVKTFSPREYRAVVYLVSFDKTKDDLSYLNGRVPYLELGTL